MAERLLKLTIEPTFGFIKNEKYTYDIIKTVGGQYFCRYTGYDDYGQKSTFKQPIKEEQVVMLLAELTSIKLNPFKEHEMVCDGSIMQIEAGDYRNKTVLRWSSGPSADGWDDVDVVAGKIIQLIPDESKT